MQDINILAKILVQTDIQTIHRMMLVDNGSNTIIQENYDYLITQYFNNSFPGFVDRTTCHFRNLGINIKVLFDILKAMQYALSLPRNRPYQYLLTPIIDGSLFSVTSTCVNEYETIAILLMYIRYIKKQAKDKTGLIFWAFFSLFEYICICLSTNRSSILWEDDMKDMIMIQLQEIERDMKKQASSYMRYKLEKLFSYIRLAYRP